MTVQAILLTLASGVILALLVWRVWRVLRPRPSLIDHPAAFFTVVGLCLLALRWPTIQLPHELNFDESQMLAQAMRFMAHPVPWRDVDGTTSGPLNSLLLTVPLRFGAPADWQTARLTLWALNCLTLFCLYSALRCFGPRSEAQLLVMPALLFYAFVSDRDFTHYSSEALSVCLLSLVCWLLAKQWRAAKTSATRWFLLGMAAGCIPFAKLQAAPVALLLVAAGFAQILLRRRQTGASPARDWPALAALGLGGLFVPGLILGVVSAAGSLDDFFKSYILASGAYAAQETLQNKFGNLVFVLLTNEDFRSYALITAGGPALFFVAWRWRKKPPGAALVVPLTVTVAACGVTLLCLLAAGKAFYHYALLLLPFLTMLIGLVYFCGQAMLCPDDAREQISSAAFKRWAGAFCVLTVGLQLYNAPLFAHRSTGFDSEHARDARSEVARQALAAKRPGDTLSVWGWMPSYYVDTGMMPATRDAIGHYVVSAGPYQDYFRKRYLRDLAQSKPALFIDAIADNTFLWNWTMADTHESFPELNDYIRDNYSLWLTIHMTNGARIGAPVRIYALKQRLAELHLSPAEIYTASDPFYPLP